MEPSLDAFYQGPQEGYAPICLRSHWDPTQISRHVLPPAVAPLPTMDPRQAVRICQQYYTTSRGDAPIPSHEEEPLVIPSALLGGPVRPEGIPVTPPGGAAGLNAPYAAYAANILEESDLQRRDEPLTKCKERRYMPVGTPTDATNTLPHVSQAFEMSPHALIVEERAGCREADDDAAWNRSGRLFNNTTRMDRYEPHSKRGPLAC
jgi:hypothetical protein